MSKTFAIINLRLSKRDKLLLNHLATQKSVPVRSESERTLLSARSRSLQRQRAGSNAYTPKELLALSAEDAGVLFHSLLRIIAL